MRILPIIAPFAVFILANSALAGVGKVSSPAVSKGELEVEYTGVRYGDSRSSLNNKQAHAYEVEYGFSDRFMLGIEGKSERESGDDDLQFVGYGVEAQYELTSQGAWWLASAMKAKYLRTPRHSEADEAELQLLLARSYGASRLVLNLGLEHELGNNRERGVALESALQARHAFNEHFAPGIEWHATHGTLNDLGRNETHYVGPMVGGALFEMGGHEVAYNIGHFWGMNNASADHATRVQLGYSVAF